MRRFIAVGLAGLLGLASSPAFAQSPGTQSGTQGVSGQNEQTYQQSPVTNGVNDVADPNDAYAQAPGGTPNPFGNVSPFLIIGGIAGGIGLIAYAVSQNQSSNPTSP